MRKLLTVLALTTIWVFVKYQTIIPMAITTFGIIVFQIREINREQQQEEA